MTVYSSSKTRCYSEEQMSPIHSSLNHFSHLGNQPTRFSAFCSTSSLVYYHDISQKKLHTGSFCLTPLVFGSLFSKYHQPITSWLTVFFVLFNMVVQSQVNQYSSLLLIYGSWVGRKALNMSSYLWIFSVQHPPRRLLAFDHSFHITSWDRSSPGSTTPAS